MKEGKRGSKKGRGESRRESIKRAKNTKDTSLAPLKDSFLNITALASIRDSRTASVNLSFPDGSVTGSGHLSPSQPSPTLKGSCSLPHVSPRGCPESSNGISIFPVHFVHS